MLCPKCYSWHVFRLSLSCVPNWQILQLTNLQTTLDVCPKYCRWQIFKLPLMCVPNTTADKSSNYPWCVSQILQMTNLQTTLVVCPKCHSWQIFRLSLSCVPNITADKSSDYPCCVSQILQLTNLQTILIVCHKNITADKCLDYFYIITLSGVTYSKIYYSVHLLHILTKTGRWAKELWVTVPLKWFDEIKCILSRSVQHNIMVCSNTTEHAIFYSVNLRQCNISTLMTTLFVIS